MADKKYQIALLIDGDNAQPSIIPPLLEALKAYGQLWIRRVYGDWTTSNLSSWHDIEMTYAIQMVQQSRYVNGKNATDIGLVIAAIDILYAGNVDAFCLVSSDSDFTPLAVRLREAGKLVIGVGKATTPPVFVNACTVFLFTENFVAKVPEPAPSKQPAPKPPAATKPDARSLLKQAYEQTAKNEGWVFLGALGQSIRKIKPTFKPKTYGQKGLSQLVSQYTALFEIRIEKGKGKSTQMYLRLKGTDTSV